MKKLWYILLALLLAGCAAVPAEMQPPEVTGSLTVQYLEEGATVTCNGEVLEIGADTDVAEDFYLDCARVTVLPSGGLHVGFGQTGFLFLGDMTREEQTQLVQQRKDALRADILQISGEPSEALLAAVQPGYVMMPEKPEGDWAQQLEVFTFEGFGPVTAESDGSSVNISWSLHVTDSVASAAGS